MNVITSNGVSFVFDLNGTNKGETTRYFTEPLGTVSFHEINEKQISIITKNDSYYTLNVANTKVEETTFNSAKELVAHLSAIKPSFPDGGGSGENGATGNLSSIEIEEGNSSEVIQDDRLIDAKSIVLIVMQSSSFQGPFEFDPETGTVQFPNQSGDMLTIFYHA